MINLKNITKIYPSRSAGAPTIALDNVSLKINGPEFVSIVGKSGAGKTTLLKMILVEERPTEGKIYFDGEDVTKIRKNSLFKLRRRVGTVFQDYKLLSSKTAYENVAYIMEIMGKRDEEIAKEITNIFHIVGLEKYSHNFPDELSGGEKQKLAIARALIHKPELILADEPTGNLDPYATLEIIRLFIKIYEMGTTVILATHDKELINILKKRVITLDQGKIIRDEERGRFTL